jgi:hypothetical protein
MLSPFLRRVIFLISQVIDALVKIQSEIYISALSFGDEFKRVDILLFP